MSTAVLISGGVDSALALARLKEQGETDLTAFYLKIWLEDELSFLGDCPWEGDLGFAREVCRQLDVPLEVISLQQDYLDRVVAAALEELKLGHTPSPDIWCNSRIKFGIFLDKIGEEYKKVASGHYAQVRFERDYYRLFRAPDPVKDQTYFLAGLNQKQLSRIIFPIGDLTKSEVRAEAQRLQLAPKDRKDSQGICFLGKIKYPDFVRYHLGEKEGDIIEKGTGKKLGKHRGVWFHTIGQRQGLGLSGGPWYVSGKLMEENLLEVIHGEQRVENFTYRFPIGKPVWIAGEAELETFDVKLRHGPQIQKARLIFDPFPVIELAEGDAGVAPGQSVIFYQGEECLGLSAIM